MSSIVAGQTLNITASNSATYLNPQSGVELGGNDSALYIDSTNWVYCSLKDNAKNIIFPNSSAKPVKADVSMRFRRTSGITRPTASAAWRVNGADIYSSTTQSDSSVIVSKNDIVLSNVTKSTTFELGGKISSTFYHTAIGEAWITLYFTRYDFAAITGEGVASATVSSATGYDGDSVTFTAEVQNGYEFVGWYAGSTLVSASQSYTHTVNGSDLQLTAISKRGGGTVIC